MNKLEKALISRKKEIEGELAKLSELLQDVPEGSIRISNKGNVDQYYLTTPEIKQKYKNGKYVRRGQEDIVSKILQRDYHRELSKDLESKLATINEMLGSQIWEYSGNVFDGLTNGRKKLVKPLILTTQQYLEQWLLTEYQGKPFAEGTAEIYTDRGERVRSKSEKIIADYMNKNGIPYKYEKPVTLVYHGRALRTVYPDFTILDVYNRREVYLEHLGLMSDKEYVKKAILKIHDYQRCGIYPGDRLLLTYEFENIMTDTKVIAQMLDPFKT